MNHFSPKVSETLKDIGVNFGGMGFCLGCVGDMYRDHERVLRLDNVLSLMPEIGEKMGWGKERVYGGDGSFRVPHVHHSHRLLDAFLEGGYPKAEEYLMSIIEKK